MTLTAHPRFDWRKVKWGGPEEPMSDSCSYCGAPIPEEACPLRLWREDGSAAVFCDPCAADAFGLLIIPPEAAE